MTEGKYAQQHTEDPTIDFEATRYRDKVEKASKAPSIPGYQLSSPIGRGGSAMVYKAEDLKLKRSVAIKLLSTRDHFAKVRFVKGARAQARVNHSNACEIYEVGEHDDWVYIAMQLIRGDTLDLAAADMDLQRKVRVMLQVVEAVHEAHRSDLIHRDLKPGNIMVVRGEPDHAYVLDFGLAKITADAGMTTDGGFMGTPAFMAPEQTIAAEVDCRTDVHALGATLYYIVAGRLPFKGDHLGTVLQSIQVDDPAPMDTSIPLDLRAVILKCLAKKPEQRYASAAALAKDLNRFLEGRPVLARVPSLMDRLGSWGRRNPRLLKLGLVASVLLMLSMTWGLSTLMRSAQRERLAHDLTNEVKEIEAMMHYAHLAPPHDLRPEMEQLDARLISLQERIKQSPSFARALGSYASGRGLLALGRHEQARQQLETAWNSGYQEPAVAYALALVYGDLYRQGLYDLRVIADPVTRRQQRESLMQRYGHKAQAQIRSLDDPTDATYLNALLALCEGRLEDGLQIISELDVKGPGWDYRARALQGDLSRELGLRYIHTGELEQGLGLFADALKAYEAATLIGRSDPKLLLGAGSVLVYMINESNGEQRTTYHTRALDLAEQALVLNPENPEAWLLKARLLDTASSYRTLMVENPQELLAAADDAARCALAYSEDASIPNLLLGQIAYRKGKALYDQRRDPGDHFHHAKTFLEQVAPDYRDYSYYYNLGRLTQMRAQKKLRGQSACGELQISVEAMERAIDLEPERVYGYSGLAVTKRMLVTSDCFTSEEIPAQLQEVVALQEAAVHLNPQQWIHYYQLGQTYMLLARGGDARAVRIDPELAKQAESQHRKALAVNPAAAHYLHNSIGAVNMALFRFAEESGQPSEAYFQASLDAYTQALTLKPKSSMFQQNLAWLHYYQGKYRVRQGRDGSAELERALEYAELANRAESSALLVASVYRIRAEQEGVHGRDPGAHFQRAHELFEDMLVKNSSHGEANRSLACLLMERARYLMEKGEDPTACLAKARTKLERAKKLMSDRSLLDLAEARLSLLQHRAGGQVTQAALQAVQRLNVRRPDLPEANLLKVLLEDGKVRKDQGRMTRSGLTQVVDRAPILAYWYGGALR